MTHVGFFTTQKYNGVTVNNSFLWYVINPYREIVCALTSGQELAGMWRLVYSHLSTSDAY